MVDVLCAANAGSKVHLFENVANITVSDRSGARSAGAERLSLVCPSCDAATRALVRAGAAMTREPRKLVDAQSGFTYEVA